MYLMYYKVRIRQRLPNTCLILTIRNRNGSLILYLINISANRGLKSWIVVYLKIMPLNVLDDIADNFVSFLLSLKADQEKKTFLSLQTNKQNNFHSYV